MILPVLFYLDIAPKADGLSRTLDKKSRHYRIHLNVTKGDTITTSEYDLDLGPAKPPKPSDPKPLQKIGPGSYAIKLANLTLGYGDYTHREALFGAGIIKFEAAAVPQGLVTDAWTLAPLLSFYVPGPGATVLTDIPFELADAGSGWKLRGTARAELANTSGQAVHVVGELGKADGTKLVLTSDATMDSSGWPLEAKADVKGGDTHIVWTLNLKS